jgi:hypothetical protein
MPRYAVDPSHLSGEGLRQWYMRTPAEIERERQAFAFQRYQDFFAGLRPPVSPEEFREEPFNRETEATAPLTNDTTPFRGVIADSGRVPEGSNPRRVVRLLPPEGRRTPTSEEDVFLDTSGAGPDDGRWLFEIGNTANRQLRKEYEKEVGPWPKTETGRNYDVAHDRAVADGGKNTLDNIRPMHPDSHVSEHMANGDYARWARRAAIARAFGGRVASSLGPLGILSNITGVLSGRIRTDTFDNFASDMIGLPSEADRQKRLEQQQKAFNPRWKPGDPIII